MPKQTKPKFTERMSTKYMLVLGSIFLAISLMLWGVHEITAPVIAEHEQITETAAMLEVLPSSHSFERGSFQHVSFVHRDDDDTRTFATIDSVHHAYDVLENKIGFIVLVDAHVDTAEDIRVIVGIRYRQHWDERPILEDYRTMSIAPIPEFETRTHEAVDNAVQFALAQVNEIIAVATILTSPQEVEEIIDEITEITVQEIEDILLEYGENGDT